MSDASITQSGTWNVATILEPASVNFATIDQSGLGTGAAPNVALISQGSRYNNASIHQAGGPGNSATIRQ